MQLISTYLTLRGWKKEKKRPGQIRKRQYVQQFQAYSNEIKWKLGGIKWQNRSPPYSPKIFSNPVDTDEVVSIMKSLNPERRFQRKYPFVALVVACKGGGLYSRCSLAAWAIQHNNDSIEFIFWEPINQVLVFILEEFKGLFVRG
jgi:hypothetical protein